MNANKNKIAFRDDADDDVKHFFSTKKYILFILSGYFLYNLNWCKLNVSVKCINEKFWVYWDVLINTWNSDTFSKCQNSDSASTTKPYIFLVICHLLCREAVSPMFELY